MKTKYIKVSIFTFLAISGRAQTLSEHPSASEVRAYNQCNLAQVNLGMTKEELVKQMGGIRVIKTYVLGSDDKHKIDDVIGNPYAKDLRRLKDGTSIEVLWYHTYLRIPDGIVDRFEICPVILEKDKVIGIGEDAYTNFIERINLK